MALSFSPRMSDLPQTRRSLLIELGNHGDDAWSEFLEIYEKAIYRLSRSRGLQDADARDVTQEVLAAVHRRLPSWDHDASRGTFRAWLMGVARNISVDSVQARARRETASGDSLVEQQLQRIPDTQSGQGGRGLEFDLEYSRSLFEWAAEQVRAQVREITWQAFQLTAVQGLAAEEVAVELGVPIGSVYTAKCRVMARIRSKVAEHQEDG